MKKTPASLAFTVITLGWVLVLGCSRKDVIDVQPSPSEGGSDSVAAAGGATDEEEEAEGGAFSTDSESEPSDSEDSDPEDFDPAPSEYQVDDCPSGAVGFATEVVTMDLGEDERFGRDQLPDIVLGGPRGGGCCSGSLDVASLGDGGSITLSFGERQMVDGPGPDLLVFENVFFVGGDEEQAFREYGKVAVSQDGDTWYEFECDPDSGMGCAGRSPTLAHPDAPDVDVFDPAQAGGDVFDLASVGLNEARYVKISDLPGDSMGFDLDAVALVHGKCDP